MHVLGFVLRGHEGSGIDDGTDADVFFVQCSVRMAGLHKWGHPAILFARYQNIRNR